MSVYEYVTNESTGTIHLSPIPFGGDLTRLVTLCGLPSAEMTTGDETLCGIAATCKSCRRAIPIRQGNLDRFAFDMLITPRPPVGRLADGTHWSQTS